MTSLQNNWITAGAGWVKLLGQCQKKQKNEEHIIALMWLWPSSSYFCLLKESVQNFEGTGCPKEKQWLGKPYKIGNFLNFLLMTLLFTLAQLKCPQSPFSTNHCFFWDTLYINNTNLIWVFLNSWSSSGFALIKCK